MSDEDKRKADENGDAEEASPDAGGDDAGDTDDELTVDDILAEAPDDGQATEDTASVLQATLEERTRDLQRLNAEFQNYRKRVERDKSRAGELATAAVLSSLLPILDDLDRAREHGDLNGPFGSVAEQLFGALAKQGLESFGDKGDAFDPTIHEAVAHMQMGDVDGPTCIDVMRHGYRLGDRLLRPALVAVAEPLDEDPAEAEASAEDADGGTEPVDGDDAEDTLVETEPEGAVESAEGDEPGEPGGPESADEPSGKDAEGGAADGDGPSAEDTKGERDS